MRMSRIHIPAAVTHSTMDVDGEGPPKDHVPLQRGQYVIVRLLPCLLEGGVTITGVLHQNSTTYQAVGQNVGTTWRGLNSQPPQIH